MAFRRSIDLSASLSLSSKQNKKKPYFSFVQENPSKLVPREQSLD